jgi:hypothetical protein
MSFLGLQLVLTIVLPPVSINHTLFAAKLSPAIYSVMVTAVVGLLSLGHRRCVAGARGDFGTSEADRMLSAGEIQPR